MSKRNITLIIIIFLLLAAVIYLNRSYAYIYNTIGNGNLIFFENNKEYLVNENMQTEKTFIYTALGDSLTAGAGVNNFEQSFPYLLSQKLAASKEKIILKSRAIPGYKSVDVKNVLLPLAVSDKPDIVTLLVGVNDIHNFVSKKDFEQNYNGILQQLTEKTSAKIYIISLPFLGSKNLILFPYNYYFDYKTKEFNEVIKNLAKTYNLKYIDLYSDSLKEFLASDSYYSNDLFHPSAKGYAFWADAIYNDINK